MDEATKSDRFTIDGTIPPGVPANWLTAAGATRAELALVYTSAVAGAGLVWWFFQRGEPWAVWQVILALVITADLFGGAVANALSSTKRRRVQAVMATPG